MIISFQHRFIFVAIPKTATHAFRTGFRPHLGPHDWEQCTLFEPKFFPVAALAKAGHGHITCRQIQPFLVPGFWESSFRFCTVRNPYDRFVSYCRFMNPNDLEMRNDPLGNMKRALEGGKSASHVLLRPQHEFVCDEDGRLLVDYVCRFEALQLHFNEICSRLRLPTTPLQRVNESTTAASHLVFDRELKEMVCAAYEKDFALFDYPEEPENELCQ